MIAAFDAPVFHDVAQNGDAWDALRLGKVTNSHAATYMALEGKPFGEPARRYALQVALEIETGRKAEYSFSNDHTERGHAQEPVAKMLYEAERFCHVGNGGFFDWGAYGDSPDGIVSPKGCIEIKSVTAPAHYATLLRGRHDPAYHWQCIGHLDCTVSDWCDFISYCSDFPDDKQLLVYRLHRAEYEDQIQRLRARRRELLVLVERTLQTLRGGPVVPAAAAPRQATSLPTSIFG